MRLRSQARKILKPKNIKKPRGYANIPVLLRGIWLSLELPIKQAIRFGEQETKTTLSHLIMNADLSGVEKKIMLSILEDENLKAVSERHNLSYKQTWRIKANALEKIKEYIRKKRIQYKKSL